MISKILKAIINNIQTFFVIWVVLLILNQIFIFHACFKSYCLLASLPHTGIIAAIITYFMIEEEIKQDKSVEKKPESDTRKNNMNSEYTLVNEDIGSEEIEDVKEPFCPKCGSKMVLRTAKKGKYVGQKFWGCTKYPKCSAILQI